MNDIATNCSTSETRATTMTARRRTAVMLMIVVDAALVAWGAMAAAAPGRLLGPGGMPILAAEYHGFTGGAWLEFAGASPETAAFVTVVFRAYGAFNVAFGLMAMAIALFAFRRGQCWAWWTLLAGNTLALVSAMRFDWVMNAIGPFELTEYLGLAAVFTALALTAPFARARSRHAAASCCDVEAAH